MCVYVCQRVGGGGLSATAQRVAPIGQTRPTPHAHLRTYTQTDRNDKKYYTCHTRTRSSSSSGSSSS